MLTADYLQEIHTNREAVAIEIGHLAKSLSLSTPAQKLKVIANHLSERTSVTKGRASMATKTTSSPSGQQQHKTIAMMLGVVDTRNPAITDLQQSGPARTTVVIVTVFNQCRSGDCQAETNHNLILGQNSHNPGG